MRSYLRTALATGVGAVVAILLAYLGAVIELLVTVGIPLGAESRENTPAEYLVLLLLAGGAAAVGGRVTARIADAPRTASVALIVVLASMMVWGFGGSPGWPSWWGPALAAIMSIGAWSGVRLWNGRSALES